MRFTREIFMNTEEECQWLRDTYPLLSVEGYPPFESFMLAGPSDETAVRIDLYAMRKPAYNTYPFAVVTQDDEGEWVLNAFITPEARVRGRPTAPAATQEEPT